MKRPHRFILLAVTLTGLPLLAACFPGTQGVAQQLLDSLGTSGGREDVVLSEALAPKSWDELAVVCPYEDPDAVAATLSIDAGDVPDLSRSEDEQAIVTVADGASESWVFSRTRVDLCGSSAWPVLHPDDRVVFEFDDERGAWVAMQ